MRSHINESAVTDRLMSGEGGSTEVVSYEFTRRQKCEDFCKRFVAFLLSSVGLTFSMIFYTFFGGIIFQYLEGENEKVVKNTVCEKLSWYTDSLWNLTEALNILYEPDWKTRAKVLLVDYTREVHNATKFKGWDGKFMEGSKECMVGNSTGEDSGGTQWTFVGSLLYSATVITTIGYGHIAPKTNFGRVATILYAIFGIPLTLLFITHLGGFMATVFRFLYKNILCGICCVWWRCCHRWQVPPRQVPTDDQDGMATKFDGIHPKGHQTYGRKTGQSEAELGSVVRASLGHNSEDDDVSNPTRRLSIPDSGVDEPKRHDVWEKHGRLETVVVVTTGLKGDDDERKVEGTGDRDGSVSKRRCCCACCCVSRRKGENCKTESVLLAPGEMEQYNRNKTFARKLSQGRDKGGERSDEKRSARENDLASEGDSCTGKVSSAKGDPDDTAERRGVTKLAQAKLMRSYLVMIKWRRGMRNALYTDDNRNVHVPLYISLLLIGGYILFGAMLFGLWEDWTFIEATYFCFITLSTIGFGDYVPGNSLKPDQSQEKLALCTLYIVFGLALLAMCFDLMQEEARSLFRKIAKKLGLAVEHPAQTHEHTPPP